MIGNLSSPLRAMADAALVCSSSKKLGANP